MTSHRSTEKSRSHVRDRVSLGLDGERTNRGWGVLSMGEEYRRDYKEMLSVDYCFSERGDGVYRINRRCKREIWVGGVESWRNIVQLGGMEGFRVSTTDDTIGDGIDGCRVVSFRRVGRGVSLEDNSGRIGVERICNGVLWLACDEVGGRVEVGTLVDVVAEVCLIGVVSGAYGGVDNIVVSCVMVVVGGSGVCHGWCMNLGCGGHGILIAGGVEMRCVME
ncbi:hypothetical protein Tco_0595355 [Tanacetum coccineum]